MKRLITIDTLSETLSIPQGSIRNALWRGQGGIRVPNPIRIGRCLRWDTEEVDRWIASQGTQNKRPLGLRRRKHQNGASGITPDPPRTTQAEDAERGR